MYKDILKTRWCGTIISMKSSRFTTFYIFIFFCFTLLSLQNTATAQTTTTTVPDNAYNQIPETPINIDISPENPGPNQYVSVYITSYGTDLNGANIIWRINGQTRKSGTGERNFSFTTGNVDSTTRLEIEIETVEGEFITKNIAIKPAGVDLVWQTDGFVPPFYKGKTMFSHQNKISFIALPHLTASNGVEISPSNLIYKWTRNGTVVEQSSGYGKNVFYMTGSIISRPVDIQVEVTSPNSTSVGSARAFVEPIEPSVIFYRKNPLYGVEFQKALTSTVDLSDSREITIVGVPLFFGVTNAFSSELSYKWLINGSQIDGDYSQNTRVFRQVEGTKGVSKISLQIEDSNKILQSASSNFSLMFGSGNTNQ